MSELAGREMPGKLGKSMVVTFTGFLKKIILLLWSNKIQSINVWTLWKQGNIYLF